MAEVEQSIAKAKLAKFVNEALGPSINEFINSFSFLMYLVKSP